VKRIASRHNPVVSTYRTLARSRRPGDRRLLLDGAHLLAEATAAGLPVTSAAFLSSSLDAAEMAALAAALDASGAEVFTVPGPLMDVMSPVRTPSGVVAIAERDPASLQQALAGSRPLVLVAAGVQEPGNVGALIRAAEAGGATGVVLGEGCADPFGWKALRGSMGSAFRLPVALVERLDAVIDAARARAIRIVATTPRGGTDLYALDLRQPTAVLLGGEGGGLPEELMAMADVRLSIPMRAPVESLNVAVAGALLVYEASRQRRAARATAPAE
jgi:TrmH family RNA methyltransferase